MAATAALVQCTCCYDVHVRGKQRRNGGGSPMITKGALHLSILKGLERTTIVCPLLVGLLSAAAISQAQPAAGANKFLGNITTRGSVRSDFMTYWNQITPENESKWGSVEGTQDRYYFTGIDNVRDFAETNDIPWKLHTLIWGSQYPAWIEDLSQSEQLAEVAEWMDTLSARYPNVTMIDVVNEGYAMHAPPPFKAALGDDGATGYDWIINSFQMARERWPRAILIYNDYNNIEWYNEVNWTPVMIEAMQQAGAPIDAIGCQAHDAHRIAVATLESNIDKLAATGLPIFITEYDIPDTNDASQLATMQEQFAMFWNHPKIVGITLWGYVVGSTWQTGTGLLNTDGTERPALTWLKEYVQDNPDPPNDFPDFLGSGSVQTVSRSVPTLRGAATRNGPGRVEIYDLQGRTIRSLYAGTQAIAVSSVIPSLRSCVVRLDGRCAGVFYKGR
jgi:endo-1,4-beta-xylanase